MEEGEKIKIGDLELNLNHFFRYFYGGFILCLTIILILPEQSGKLYQTLGGNNLQGNIFLIFLFVAIGTALYVFYKIAISELLIDKIHFNCPKVLWGHSKEDCIFQYLLELRIEKKHLLIAFRLIRDKVFDSSIQNIYHLRHSETHVLYITSSVCFIGLLVRLAACLFEISSCDAGIWILIPIVGLISLLCGLYSDKKLCADQCYYSRLNENGIKEKLIEAKLINPENQSGP